MNMDELESKLHELEPRNPSGGFADRVLAQKPEYSPRPAPWWRRGVTIPVPALAVLLVLFILVQILQWRHAQQPERVITKSTRSIEIAFVESPAEHPFDMTRDNLPFFTAPVVMETHSK